MEKLKCVGYLNGIKLEVPLSGEVCVDMMKNLSRSMGAYYSCHQDEYAALCKEKKNNANAG